MARRAVLQDLKARQSALGPSIYAAVFCLVVLAAAGLIGTLAHAPWLFPSLGPTVMLFFESPEQPSSRPLNALVGHGVGLVAGIACLYAFGLQNVPAAPVGGLKPLHVVAGALSVALTTLILTLLKKPHPPAGATTLIVSLGILSQVPELIVMAASIIFVTALGWGLNLALGTKPASETKKR